MIKKTVLYSFVFAGSWILIDKYSISYSFSDFKEATTILLSVAGMVFTIMGIWIAFLYPNALKRLVNPEKIKVADFSETLNETKRLEFIVASVLKSALVVLSIMIMFLGKLLLYKTNLYDLFTEEIKTTLLAALLLMSFVLIESVVDVVSANVMFLNDLHNKREDREIDESI